MNNNRQHVFVSALLMWSLAGCGPALQSTTLSLQNLNCQSCGKQAEEGLAQKEGIYESKFDMNSAEVHLKHDPQLWDGEKLAAASKTLGFPALLGAGKGFYEPFPTYPDGVDLDWLSKDGEEYDPKTARVEGKVTIVDFYAPWCGPCREVDRHLIRRFEEGGTFAVRKVNLVDWSSPVAKQMGATLTNLPFVQVYGPDGVLRDTIVGLNFDRLDGGIQGSVAP